MSTLEVSIGIRYKESACSCLVSDNSLVLLSNRIFTRGEGGGEGRGGSKTVADLLSRVPKDPNEPSEIGSSADESLPDISNKTYEIWVLNSNQFPQEAFSKNEMSNDELLDQPRPGFTGFDLQKEQARDTEIQDILKQLQSGRASKTLKI